jgi:hypoxanthine phosphoribosyltransferase
MNQISKKNRECKAIHETEKVKSNVISISNVEVPQKIKCFVMMPFGSNNEYNRKEDESNFIFENIICPSIERFKIISNAEVEVIREVDKNVSGSITKSILKNIATADICIVDITGRNANVFFELGIRYCLRNKTTILLRQEETKIPFDIQGYRCMTYDCFKPNAAIVELSEFLVSGTKNLTTSDSLVFETFPDMEVYIPGIVKSIRKSYNLNVLSWDDWWKRVLELATLLKDPFDNGRFVPTAVVGISNGGLVVADFLGREVFKGIPILSLWANRWLDAKSKSKADQTCYFFDNEFNRAVLQPLKTMYPDKNTNLTILLTDDLVYTSNTIIQASTFIKKELGENINMLFTPLYCRTVDYLNTIKQMLPFDFNNGETFRITKDEYYKRLRVFKASFPYMKDLGYE